MIVSDDTISKALAYLAEDPHPVALARKDIADAENHSKEVYAKAFIGAVGSVEARKAIAEVSPEYAAAKAEESEAILQFERHKARSKAADMLIDVWRSEQANVRAAERVR